MKFIRFRVNYVLLQLKIIMLSLCVMFGAFLTMDIAQIKVLGFICTCHSCIRSKNDFTARGWTRAANIKP